MAVVSRPPNGFLQSLSEGDFESLRSHLTAVELKHEAILYGAGDEVSSAYFPYSGVVSLVVLLMDGERVEAGMIGRDGLVGSSAALDGPYALNQAIVQVPGAGTKIEIDFLRRAARQSEALRAALYRHDQLAFAQAQQSAACNAKHPIESRLCRWLLRTRDLTESDQLPLTQDFISQMLGVRRTSVTMEAKKLHQAGLIEYRRGRILILDRDGLEECACECYRTIRERQHKLISAPTS